MIKCMVFYNYMDECSYMQPWSYFYPNRKYNEATYWIGFTTTQFMPRVQLTENIRI